MNEPPAPMPAASPQESPLDRAVKELQPAEASQESPLDRAVRALGVPFDGSAPPPTQAPVGPSLRCPPPRGEPNSGWSTFP